MSDKILTSSGFTVQAEASPRLARRERKTRGKPFQVVRFHSISVPIHAFEQRGRTRYTIAFHKDGQRQRRMLTDIEDAKREAKFSG